MLKNSINYIFILFFVFEFISCNSKRTENQMLSNYYLNNSIALFKNSRHFIVLKAERFETLYFFNRKRIYLGKVVLPGRFKTILDNKIVIFKRATEDVSAYYNIDELPLNYEIVKITNQKKQSSKYQILAFDIKFTLKNTLINAYVNDNLYEYIEQQTYNLDNLNKLSIYNLELKMDDLRFDFYESKVYVDSVYGNELIRSYISFNSPCNFKNVHKNYIQKRLN
jgi:hypothetical protein